jgi:hypothetical protein
VHEKPVWSTWCRKPTKMEPNSAPFRVLLWLYIVAAGLQTASSAALIQKGLLHGIPFNSTDLAETAALAVTCDCGYYPGGTGCSKIRGGCGCAGTEYCNVGGYCKKVPGGVCPTPPTPPTCIEDGCVTGDISKNDAKSHCCHNGHETERCDGTHWRCDPPAALRDRAFEFTRV